MQTRTTWRRQPLRQALAVAKLGGSAEDPEDPRKGGVQPTNLFSNVDETFKHQQGSVLGQAVLVAGKLA